MGRSSQAHAEVAQDIVRVSSAVCLVKAGPERDSFHIGCDLLDKKYLGCSLNLQDAS